MISARHLPLLILLIPALLHAGIRDPAIHSEPKDLVLINVLVTDLHGNPVTGLDASKFRLFEDGMEQVLKYCKSEDAPVSVGLILDTSGSMSSILAPVKKAVDRFIRETNPSNEYFIVEFQSHPHVVTPFTTDMDLLSRAIDHLESGGNTALFDAVYVAVDQMRTAKYSQKALLIVSDGLNLHSHHSERQTRRLAAKVDFPIYSICLYGEPRSQTGRHPMPRGDDAILNELSSPTGGRNFTLLSSKKLQSTMDLIAAEIRHQYILAYVPSDHTTASKFHRIRIHVQPQPGHRFRVSNRSGYFPENR